MPRVVYFDCPSGAAGDMIMGALVDAGAPLDRVRAGLGGLRLDGWELTARQVMKGPFRATKVEVEIDRTHHHPDRSLGDILAILDRSTLDRPVVERACRIFRRLAEAEARVHGASIGAVHFHDVGAVDAIVDVTGAVLALSLLDVEAVHISALPIGGGFVDGTHGRIPIPGPGTLELLRGVPLVDTGVRAELVTPTGAAILTTLACSAGRMPSMTVDSVGYGAGTMDLPGAPNVLRCLVGLTGEETLTGRVVQLEATIDDMSPQLFEPLMERLFAAGALDVFMSPVVMKKSRPGIVLTVLCEPHARGGVSRVVFEETTSIGVRWDTRERATLAREVLTFETSYGPVPVKVSRLDGAVVTVTPEFDAVARIARDRHLPVREVLEQARADARRSLGMPLGR